MMVGGTSRVADVLWSALMGLTFFVAAPAQTSCGGTPATSPRPHVVVTTSLLECAVYDVAGEAVAVTRLVPPRACPGHFDATPSDLERIAGAVAFLRHDYQEYLDKRLAQAGKRARLTFVIPTQGAQTIPAHYLALCTAVAAALSECFPDNAAVFHDRLTATVQAMRAMEDEARQQFMPKLRGRPVVASQLQKEFCEWLGLQVVAVLDDADQASLRGVEEVVRTARAAGACAVVCNLQRGTRVAAALAQKLAVPVIVLSNFPDAHLPEGGIDGSFRITSPHWSRISLVASEPVVVMEAVGVVRGHHAILADINLAVGAGELMGIVGPNGAGKTTLLRLINATIQPTSGVVRVFGMTTGGFWGHNCVAIRRQVATVPQLLEPCGAAPLRLREVVEMGRYGRVGMLRRLSPADREIAWHWMERLGIAHLAECLYQELSGGEQRKAHLARALAQEPQILLLDEPTSNLDLRWQEELTLIIGEIWKEQSVTILCVTHEPHLLPPGTGRILLLAEGRLLASGLPKAVLTPECLARVFCRPVRTASQSDRSSLFARQGSQRVYRDA